jgi:hypothetical protein
MAAVDRQAGAIVLEWVAKLAVIPVEMLSDRDAVQQRYCGYCSRVAQREAQRDAAARLVRRRRDE